MYVTRPYRSLACCCLTAVTFGLFGQASSLAVESTFKAESWAQSQAVIPVQPAQSDRSAQPVQAGQGKAISSAIAGPSMLSGMTSFQTTISSKNYELGMKALEHRLYKEAENRFEQALSEFRKNGKNRDYELLTRLGLGEAYFAQDKIAQARQILFSCKSDFVGHFGAESLETARLVHDQAAIELADGNLLKATPLAQEAFAMRLKVLGPEHHDTAVTLALVAKIQDQRGQSEEAVDNLKKALHILELRAGIDRLDYANAVSGLSLAKRHLGEEEESRRLAETAISLKDMVVRFDKTPASKGLVKFVWQDGMYGSKQVPDPIYPLKYVVINGLRVACTVVRSDKHMAVLISLANCSKRPMQLSVGPVTLEKTSPGREQLRFCDPALLDIPLEEEHISDLTWRRRWLCHIQKTRNIPGYLQNGELDPENFFGNNTFGLYGNWDMVVVDAPPVVTREQFLFDQKRLPYDVDLLGFMRGSSSDIRPTSLNPGEARTGLVFFLRQRYETANVRITIGNAVVDFPFRAAVGQ